MAETLVNIGGLQTVIRHHFLGWQCRLRQYAVREERGRPSPGMQPDIALPDGRGFGGVKVMMTRKDPITFTQELRHMVRRTRDPKQRFESALRYLSSTFYQYPREFSDRMTALFAKNARAAQTIHDANRAVLLFSEKNQSYTIPAEVRRLVESDPAWQATYWHNHLFNARLPGEVTILQFVPDWAHATANLPVY